MGIGLGETGQVIIILETRPTSWQITGVGDT
jgi:hypothetical protein